MSNVLEQERDNILNFFGWDEKDVEILENVLNKSEEFEKMTWNRTDDFIASVDENTPEEVIKATACHFQWDFINYYLEAVYYTCEEMDYDRAVYRKYLKEGNWDRVEDIYKRFMKLYDKMAERDNIEYDQKTKHLKFQPFFDYVYRKANGNVKKMKELFNNTCERFYQIKNESIDVMERIQEFMQNDIPED